MKNDSMYSVAVWREIGLMSKTAAWGVLGLKIGAEMKAGSDAAVYVARWGVENGGCWVALWGAKVGIAARMYVGSGEMLTANCCCWGGEGCTDSIEISEITEKDSTGLDICCEIAAENAAKCAEAGADAGADAGSTDADAGAGSTDGWTCWIGDDLTCCLDGVWTCCTLIIGGFDTAGIFWFGITNEVDEYSLPCQKGGLGFSLPCRSLLWREDDLENADAISIASTRFFSAFRKFFIVENVNFSIRSRSFISRSCHLDLVFSAIISNRVFDINIFNSRFTQTLRCFRNLRNLSNWSIFIFEKFFSMRFVFSKIFLKQSHKFLSYISFFSHFFIRFFTIVAGFFLTVAIADMLKIDANKQINRQTSSWCMLTIKL